MCRVSGSSIEILIYPWSSWPQVASVWSELSNTSPYSSFFLSPEWVECWLEVFGSVLQPEILLFRTDAVFVGACLLVFKTERRGPFLVRRVYLNTAGENEADSLCIEFNDLLCLAGWEEAVARRLATHLQSMAWDEFALNGCSRRPSLEALGRTFTGIKQVTFLRPSYYVDLAQLRRVNSDYESSLSSGLRKQLRQNFRKYGEVRLEAANEVSGALAMIEELADLHQHTWRERGQSGAFASTRFFAFHRSLIQRAFPRGAIQLLRVASGDRTIGMLYNFIHHGKVYFYQSGLRYNNEDKQLKPGFVALVLAIRYCHDHGLDEYDFLAGDASYKERLATECRNLAWVIFQRPSLKMRFIEHMRQVKRKMKTIGSLVESAR